MADLPGVGDHLQDHLEVYIQYTSLQPVSMQPSATQLWRRPFIGAEWLFLRSGPGATNHFEGGGFARSNDDVAYPNLMFHFLPLAIRYDGSAGAAGHGYQVHVGPMYSDARGSVTLKTTDPHDHPALRFNYLSTEQDRREWVEAVRVARRILNQPAMDPFNGGETSPGPSVTTDDEIRDWVARDAETALHPSCTARMGTDPGSVLDPLSMRVHGTDGLRVVDASAMPYITNGNIYAPVMMLAEKAADLILGNTPLPPEPIPFYRHGAPDFRTACRISSRSDDCQHPRRNIDTGLDPVVSCAPTKRGVTGRHVRGLERGDQDAQAARGSDRGRCGGPAAVSGGRRGFVHAGSVLGHDRRLAPVRGRLSGGLGSGLRGDASHLRRGRHVWQGTFSLPAGSYEYKAALNNAWDENYGLHAGSNGANIPLDLAVRRERQVLLRPQDATGRPTTRAR